MKFKTLSMLLLCWVSLSGIYAQQKAPEGFVCVEEQPEGELRVYTRHGKIVKEIEEGRTEEEYRRYVVKGGEQDGSINLVFAADGVVWFQRPVSDSYYDGWVRGTLSADGRTITVPMGQYTAYTRSFDMAVQVWMLTYDEANDTFVPDQSITEVTYSVLDDGSIALNGSDENHVMGCVNRAFGDTFHYLDFEWNGNGDYATVYTPSGEMPLTPPDGLQSQTLYATTGWHDGVGWAPYLAEVSLAFDGDVVWLQGVTDLLPKAWVKGQRHGDRLTFASRQFLGSYYSSPVYLIGVESDDQGNPVVSDSITFTVNADGTYTSFDDIMVSSKRNDVSYLAYYMGMTLAPELDRVVTAPDGLRLTGYTLDCQEPDDQGRLVRVPSQMVSAGAAPDGRFYLQGISPFAPEAFIEGTIDADRRLTFRSPQYLGEFFDETSGIVYPIYFQAFHGTTGQLLPEVTFAYDEATHAYVRPTTAISIGINKTGLLTQQYIYNATLTPTTTGPGQERGAAIVSLLTDKLTYSPTETMTVTGQVENLSAAAIGGYELTCFVDGEQRSTQTVTLTLQPGEQSAFSQTLPMDGLAEGKHVLKVLTTTGGLTEQMSVTFYVYESSYVRTLLLEHFTSLPCVNCPRDDEKLEQVCHARSDVAWVSHHVGFEEDEFTIDASKPLVFFGVDGNPFVMLDRTAFSEGAPPAFTIGSYDTQGINTIFDYAASMPAFLQLQVATDVTDGQLSVSVSGEAKAFFTELYPRATIHVYLVEDEVLAENPQAGDATKRYHDNILRTVVTPVRGLLPTWDDETTFSCQTSVALNPAWNPDHLRVVAFAVAQAPSGTNYPTGEVLNTAQARISSASAIRNVTAADGRPAAAAYTLGGRILRSAAKGLTIQNGKKTITK